MRRRELLVRAAGATVALLVGCSPAAPSAPRATTAPERARTGKPVDLWNGPGLDARVLFQREIDRLPDGPLMLRVTELELEPGATVDPHTHLGPGVQVVLGGAFTVVETASASESVYESTAARPFAIYYSGMITKYSTENRGTIWNRLFMAELLPRSRGFLGNQQFELEGGTHNTGGVRSGPYVQAPFDGLPDPPLMVRVTQIDMGPKGKTPEYTRPGPGVFFVASGQGTFRHQEALSITTHGAGGYYFDAGVDPIILENKPITPARIVAVEFLPASLGKQASTTPTGRDVNTPVGS